MTTTIATDVLIAGGGPCGLMLALELGRRGINVLLVDEKPDTAFNPQANATQARTMEHFRRLGFADEVRALGLPGDYPTDIAYFTRFSTHELARLSLPAAKDATRIIKGLGGSWSAAELPHRVSQKFVERVLRQKADALPSTDIRYSWRLEHFADTGEHVTAAITSVTTGERIDVHSRYLVGADGPRSLVRETLGIRYAGGTGTTRDFMGGRMCAVYAKAPDFYARFPHRRAWMHMTLNKDRRCLLAAVNGRDEFAFHTQLRAHEPEAAVTDPDARRMFAQAMGCPIDIEVLSRAFWTAGHALYAETFQRGRVFIGGDAAHLFTPTGGLGYNTAVEDAVNLGWKLAAVIKGQGGDGLLESYARERVPLAKRNTGYARAFADSLGLITAPDCLEDNSDEGRAARATAGAYLDNHARTEFNIPGVTFGGRYDDSNIIASDGTAPPPDTANAYVPTACPGGRPPHMWLDDATSLYDRFGPEWTLLRLSPNAGGERLARAFADRGINLATCDVDRPDLRDLYEADLALIRPDQIVAWRGSDRSSDPSAIVKRVLGLGTT